MPKKFTMHMFSLNSTQGARTSTNPASYKPYRIYFLPGVGGKAGKLRRLTHVFSGNDRVSGYVIEDGRVRNMSHEVPAATVHELSSLSVAALLGQTEVFDDLDQSINIVAYSGDYVVAIEMHKLLLAKGYTHVRVVFLDPPQFSYFSISSQSDLITATKEIVDDVLQKISSSDCNFRDNAEYKTVINANHDNLVEFIGVLLKVEIIVGTIVELVLQKLLAYYNYDHSNSAENEHYLEKYEEDFYFIFATFNDKPLEMNETSYSSIEQHLNGMSYRGFKAKDQEHIEKLSDHSHDSIVENYSSGLYWRYLSNIFSINTRSEHTEQPTQLSTTVAAGADMGSMDIYLTGFHGFSISPGTSPRGDQGCNNSGEEDSDTDASMSKDIVRQLLGRGISGAQ